MNWLRAFRVFSLGLLLWMPAGPMSAEESKPPPPARPDLVHMRRFSIEKDQLGNASLEVDWYFPPELAPAFESAPDAAVRRTLGIEHLRRQANDGDPLSRIELGYCRLYGYGLPRDLAEAERLLRESDDNQLPWRVALLAWEYTRDPIQWPRAAELALESLDAGSDAAVALAVWLIRHPEARRADAELQERLLQAVLARDPGDADTLLEMAHIRLRRKEYEAVWSLATRALADPDLAGPAAQDDAAARRLRTMAHLLRVQSAMKTGRGTGSVSEDIRALAAAIPFRGRAVGAAVAALGIATVLAIGAWLTRRRGERGPGGWLTAGWIGASPVLLGVALFHPVPLAVAALLLALSIACALAPSVRRTYFAPRPRRGLSGVARDALRLFACLAAVLAVGAAYAELYRRIAGHPLEDQFIRGFIRLDTPLNVALSVFTIVLAIPFYEEVVYRGFLTDALGRRLPPAAATLCAAAAFGLVHGWAHAIPVAALGLAAGLLRLRERSLWLPVALHAVFNGLALALIAAGA